MPARFLLVLLPLVLLGRSLVPAVADDKPADADGWIVLFDGKSLEGWHKNPQRIGHGTGGQWQVEDGVITGQQDPPGSGNGGILLTDQKFGDFEVSTELKPDWGICSGFFLRSTETGQCLQMMVDYHDAGNVGLVYGEGVGGFNTRPFEIFGEYGDDKQLVGLTTKPTAHTPPKFSISGEEFVKLWKIDDWNEARVRVVGNPAHMTVWINGTKVCEFDGETYRGKNYDKAKVAETLGPTGHIALQVHGGKSWPSGAKCRWRNIKVRAPREGE